MGKSILDVLQNTIIVKISKSLFLPSRFSVQETGDYKICFDNKFSYLSSKTVYFEIFNINEDEEYDDLAGIFDDEELPEEYYDVQVSDIEVMGGVWFRVIKPDCVTLNSRLTQSCVKLRSGTPLSCFKERSLVKPLRLNEIDFTK